MPGEAVSNRLQQYGSSRAFCMGELRCSERLATPRTVKPGF